jgi:hypothetical protein
MTHILQRIERLERHGQRAERQARFWRGAAILLALLGLWIAAGSGRAHGDDEREIAALRKQVKALAQLFLAKNPVNGQPFFSRRGADFFVTGANVHIVNGLGATNGNPADPTSLTTSNVNGFGNLIVGYNESRVPGGGTDVRTGSHNIVLGQLQNFSSFGGLADGFFNDISGPYASVTGGSINTASAIAASVSGGSANTASNNYSSVSGGFQNAASEFFASVSGGNGNTASGAYASVSAGNANTASGRYASVSAGSFNEASGPSASISGGFESRAKAEGDSVSGGFANIASGGSSSVSGGGGVNLTAAYGWAAGGTTPGPNPPGQPGTFHSP